MSLTFKGPDEIAQDYLDNLKLLKPEVNTDQTDSDWWVRGQVVGGTLSGLSADLSVISDDAFPQSARRDAVEQHLITYFGSGFIQPQPAAGSVLVSGTVGTLYPAATQFIYSPNGNTYQSLADFTLAAATGLVGVQSSTTGQSQNLNQGAILTLPSPPSGSDPTATVFGGPIADGRDVETTEEAVARILARIQQPPAGGTASDYQQYALAADPRVTSAQVLRFIYGLGTLGIIVTAGTTDIDAAINSGTPIIRVPDDSLVLAVSAYIQTVKVLTDSVFILKPNEIPVDVTFRRRYVAGSDGSTIDATTGLTYDALLTREIGRVIYKLPTGGRQINGAGGASGFILASEIEEGVDDQLSTGPYGQGLLASIVADRQIDDLSASGTNRYVLNDQIFVPGTISLVDM